MSKLKLVYELSQKLEVQMAIEPILCIVWTHPGFDGESLH